MPSWPQALPGAKRQKQALPTRGYSAVRLVYHGWAWPTCATSTTLPCRPNASCYRPTRATCFIRDTLVFVRVPSDVSSFVLTAISNENRELSHTTPEAAKSTPEAATLATLVQQESYSCCLTGTTLPLVLGVRQRCSRCRSDPCQSSRTAEYPPSAAWRHSSHPSVWYAIYTGPHELKAPPTDVGV